jgi:hypothetical protein
VSGQTDQKLLITNLVALVQYLNAASKEKTVCRVDYAMVLEAFCIEELARRLLIPVFVRLNASTVR